MTREESSGLSEPLQMHPGVKDVAMAHFCPKGHC